MARKELTTFRIRPDVLEALRDIKARDGVPIGVSVDFALEAWLKKKGYRLKAPRRPVVSRTRRG